MIIRIKFRSGIRRGIGYIIRKPLSKHEGLIMKEFFKKGFYLGVGAFALTKEKIEQVVDDLVRKGDADQSERASLVDEFMGKAQEFEKELGKKVKEIIQTYGYVPRRDLDELKKRVEKLEKAAAAKKPAARKSTATKAASPKAKAKPKTAGKGKKAE